MWALSISAEMSSLVYSLLSKISIILSQGTGNVNIPITWQQRDCRLLLLKCIPAKHHQPLAAFSRCIVFN